MASRAERAARARGDIRISISGWRYAPWRGRFYPRGLAQKKELAYASRMLASIELNGSFYSLQRPASYQAWHDETPEGFVFAIKGSRYITQMLHLDDVHTALANFLASGVLALGRKLGPFLWQLPPCMRFDAQRMDRFLSLLPYDAKAVAALARAHDAQVNARSVLTAPRGLRGLRLRHAVEVRHPSFVDSDFIALLRRHGVALVVADTAGRWPLIEDLTADFVYIRLHGDKALYASGYGDAALDRWAARIRAWHAGRQVAGAALASPVAARRGQRDVYCHFDNDTKVRAPYNAARLAWRLGLRTGLGDDDRFAGIDETDGIELPAASYKSA
ncbi:hypothetical protein D3C86_1299120 [compost metagenome]